MLGRQYHYYYYVVVSRGCMIGSVPIYMHGELRSSINLTEKLSKSVKICKKKKPLQKVYCRVFHESQCTVTIQSDRKAVCGRAGVYGTTETDRHTYTYLNRVVLGVEFLEFLLDTSPGVQVGNAVQQRRQQRRVFVLVGGVARRSRLLLHRRNNSFQQLHSTYTRDTTFPASNGVTRRAEKFCSHSSAAKMERAFPTALTKG